MTINNSAVAGNSVVSGNGTASGQGGGINNNSANTSSLSVNNSTVSGNMSYEDLKVILDAELAK